MRGKRDYRGRPVEMRETLQRLVIRKPTKELPEKAAELSALPETELTQAQVKRLPPYLGRADITCVYEGEDRVLWVGTREGLWRINEAEPEPLDRVQCFRATAYLLDNNVKAVMPDGAGGVWVLTDTCVSHIQMKLINAQEKAALLSEINYKYMNRRGMLGGGRWDQEKKTFVGKCTDNDGLWTSLVAMGDLCRYAVLRDEGTAPPEEIARARELAMLWTEACLLLAYIPGWKGSVPAFVRYNKPASNRASDEYLIEGREYKINLPERGPLGMLEFVPAPANPGDWAKTDAMPEIVFRNVEGYIARSYHVNSPDDPIPFADGVFFRKKFTPEGKPISVRIPTSTYKGDDIPPLLSVDSSMEIPKRLKKLYNTVVNPQTGRCYGDDDITYKCDTSNDELVGHYALWYLAYEILGPEDPELAGIIRVIAARHAKHIRDNNYCLTDAGGQPTSWARMSREYYMNKDYHGITDAPLGLSILLQLFKVAYHVTGDEQWNAEYRKLALEEPYRYADLLSEYYDRTAALMRRRAGRDLSDEEVFKTFIKVANYSDARMSAISYYTLMQLEDEEALRAKYRAGIESWWKFLKYSRDVEWCLVYQLAYPEAERFDAFGRPCGEMVRWQLMRFPLNNRMFEIDNRTRPGVFEDGGKLWYPDGVPCALPMDERGAGSSDVFAAVEGSREVVLRKTYNMIMPYWLGRYHKLLVERGQKSEVSLDDIEELIFQDR
jgi:hypothetical protein